MLIISVLPLYPQTHQHLYSVIKDIQSTVFKVRLSIGDVSIALSPFPLLQLTSNQWGDSQFTGSLSILECFVLCSTVPHSYLVWLSPNSADSSAAACLWPVRFISADSGSELCGMWGICVRMTLSVGCLDCPKFGLGAFSAWLLCPFGTPSSWFGFLEEFFTLGSYRIVLHLGRLATGSGRLLRGL